MLDLSKDEGRGPKCFFSSTTLPTFVNHTQPPMKKKPFSTVINQTYSHTLRVVLPEEGATALNRMLASGVGTLSYARVHMKLDELIEGEFFNQYIKSGNVLMLSEGRSGVDQIYSLVDGVLRLEVDNAMFERIGLQGKPVASAGRKHIKARYAIEINLRQPSMVRDKPGFERVVWAFKNVLNQTKSWLFHDFNNPVDFTGPIATHQPILRTVDGVAGDLEGVMVPTFPDDFHEDGYIDAANLLEWLGMAMSGSSLIQQSGRMDPYLCRYVVPGWEAHLLPDTGLKLQNLVRLHWNGFIPSAFAKNILLAALKASGSEWFAMSATTFDGKAYTILQNGSHTMTWEYED